MPITGVVYLHQKFVSLLKLHCVNTAIMVMVPWKFFSFLTDFELF